MANVPMALPSVAASNTMYLTLDGKPELYYVLNRAQMESLVRELSTQNPVIPVPAVSVSTEQFVEAEEYMERDQVAKILHVDKSTLWRWAKEGKLNFIKVGSRRVLYKTEDVKNLLTDQK